MRNIIKSISEQRVKTFDNQGLTLIEVVVASGIFAIAFAGALVAQQMASSRADQSIISFLVTTRGNSLVETFQSFPYEDEIYSAADSNSVADISNVFGAHDNVYGAFSSSSGVVDSSDNKVEDLDEEDISLKYKPTVVTQSNTAEDPFTQASSLDVNDRLLGPEDEDKNANSNPLTGEWFITEDQRAKNMFANSGEGQERYYFMDDVDDFDGYQEKVEIVNGLEVTFSVSVSGVYPNFDDFDYTIQNFDGSTVANVTWDQDKLAPMEEISVANIQSEFSQLSSSDQTLIETYKLGFGYYSSMLFKKITIKAEYFYPPGSSGDDHKKVFIIHGGSVNPNGSAL